MINKIEVTFSIQDLEILSGIKAHNIRIWEKRYNLLNPSRLNRNIREYSLLDLQKILNVSILYKNGYKVSKLSKLSDGDLENEVKRITAEKFKSNNHINSLILSMFSFDEDLFEKNYSMQSKEYNFSEIFSNTYLPLLQYIGILWQTNTIKPAHERFIFNLIYQKIVLNTAKISHNTAQSTSVNVLFLPEGELHELGLLFMAYRLKLNGQKTIYLGKDIPVEDLYYINSQFPLIKWISSFTVNRTDEDLTKFVLQMEDLLEQTNNTCYVIGKIWNSFSATNQRENFKFYEGFDRIILDLT